MIKHILIGFCCFYLTGCATVDQQQDLNISSKPKISLGKIENTFSESTIQKGRDLVHKAKITGEKVFYKNDEIRILALDKFFNNNFKYETDKNNYGKEDYWASLIEMVDKNQTGDCEDFTFGKITLAQYFNISDDNILIGYTKIGEHLFPVFHDTKKNKYIVSENSGRIRTLEETVKRYPDVKFFSLDEIFKTDEILFVNWKNEGSLNKVTSKVSAGILSDDKYIK